ncbi:hypothetical protein ACFQO8_10635 [Exiguobacterium aestuarii]|uniref:Uncharacterized protein n=1 Tax=Exiguobacterium aestuarii TaxID=273527 RepID=A0ABW2PME4_9BACL|nr:MULTISPECIES: hypothetical protein [Exiguobacterium]MCT4786860.1 hypothetical protein [Exiguobacterium aestuarii]
MDKEIMRDKRVKKLYTKEEEVKGRKVFVKEENEKMKNSDVKKEELFTYKCG